MYHIFARSGTLKNIVPVYLYLTETVDALGINALDP